MLNMFTLEFNHPACCSEAGVAQFVCHVGCRMTAILMLNLFAIQCSLEVGNWHKMIMSTRFFGIQKYHIVTMKTLLNSTRVQLEGTRLTPMAIPRFKSRNLYSTNDDKPEEKPKYLGWSHDLTASGTKFVTLVMRRQHQWNVCPSIGFLSGVERGGVGSVPWWPQPQSGSPPPATSNIHLKNAVR